MAQFSVPVVTIKGIEPIPDADRIEPAVVEGYRSVIVRGQFVPGDLAVYIPEGSMVKLKYLNADYLTRKGEVTEYN